MNLGDIALSQVLYFHFTTRQFSTGAPITSSGLVLSVYKDDSVTQSTAGITTTFTTGFDGVVGLVSVKIDTSADGTFYAAGHDFSVVITTGTSDSVSIVGEVVGYFSIQNRSAIRPTTSGRTINIDSTGLADSNVVKLGPTGSGTAQTARDIGASVLVGDKTGFALSTGGVQAIWDALTSALSTASSIGKLLVDNINATITSRMATYTQPTGFLSATFPSGTISNTTNITAGTIATVSGNVTGSVGSVASYGTLVADIATSVWGAVTRTLTAASDSAGVSTLLTRIASVLTITTGKVDVNDKTDFSLAPAYDAAKTAAQAGDAMTLTAAYDAAKTAMQDGGNAVATNMRGTDNALLAADIDLTSGKVNIGKINDTTITGDGQPGTEFGV